MKNILTFWLLLISVVINAQTISVTGFYKDKKSNPIEEAFVKYIYNDGLEADSTYTSITGLFTLNVNTTVGTVELSEPLFDKPFPNPFSSIVQFNVQVEKESEVLIHNLRSEQIARISIPKIGLYHISWGGLKSTGDPVSTGIYIISVVNRDKSQSHKVIYQHNGSGFGMLKAELMNNQISLKSTNAIDNIEFNKENTSFLELSLSNPTQDTSLGVITGNVGPENLGEIITVVNIDDLNQWNLNPYFYNDDLNVYEVDDTENFSIVNDSILEFTGTETGVYEPVITATDSEDNELTAFMEAEITVTSETVVEISGFYVDQLDNPIATADVYYYESGENLLAQTSTGSDGSFDFTIISDETTMDSLLFEKVNTTDYSIGFFTPQADTSLGDLTGNVGPDNTDQLTVTSHLDSTNQWNLNDYFYNDDQSDYVVDDEDNFNILNDSILEFIGTASGQYYPQITATDVPDPSLEDYMSADIEITEERTFDVSGTYVDKVNDPIESADVYYYKEGITLLDQTTTDAAGDFVLTVYVESTTTDSIFFEKANTTDKHIGFITPWSDTTLNSITGNIGPTATGDIDELHFTIENMVEWNLNSYFPNDDQSAYSITGTDFTISEDTLLKLVISDEGTFSTTVTATDPEDNSLTADMDVSVEVEYTIAVPDTSVMEDSGQDTLFADLDAFINPNFPNDLSYTIVSQSNSELINLEISGSVVLIDSLQTDGFGSSLVEIEIDDTFDLDTISFTVDVLPLTDLSGNVADIFDSTFLANVVLTIVQNGDTIRDTTDANGFYKLQLNTDSDTAYIPVTLNHGDYTPFHTWTVLIYNADTVFDYDMIPDDFYWDLYNEAFRGNLKGDVPGYGPGNMQWSNPPVINLFEDNSYVGGQDLTANVATMLDNLENILPTFNPRDAIFANVITHETLFPLPDYEVMIYWDNSIAPAAGVALVAPVGDGPEILKASAKFRYPYDPDESDNVIYNQELGTIFGATEEPTSIPGQDSVFTEDSQTPDTYTAYDYDCADVYLNRSRIHYWNQSASGLNAYDWEIRPDLVSNYYPSGAPNKAAKIKKFIYYIFYEDGTRETIHYKYDEIPEDVKLMFPEMFEGYIQKRMDLEKEKVITITTTTKKITTTTQKVLAKIGEPVKVEEITESKPLQMWLKEFFPEKYN